MEIEAKIKLTGDEEAESLRALILELWRSERGLPPTVDVSTHLEHNVYYDRWENVHGAMGRKTDTAIRIRRLNIGGKPVGAVFTVKGPVGEGKYKTREEHEIQLSYDDSCVMATMLEQLGYCATISFEKTRNEFTIPDGTKIALDLLPLIGWFIEVEGNESKITEVLTSLNLLGREIIKKGYPSLLMENIPGDPEFPVVITF